MEKQPHPAATVTALRCPPIRQSMDEWKTPAFWTQICPDLTILHQNPITSRSCDNPRSSSSSSSSSSSEFASALCDHDSESSSSSSLRQAKAQAQAQPQALPQIQPQTQPELMEANGRLYREQLRHQGYALVDDDRLLSRPPQEGNDNNNDNDVRQWLVNGIQALHSRGFPATFIYLFDEIWLYVAEPAAKLLRASTHEKNTTPIHFDMLAWRILHPDNDHDTNSNSNCNKNTNTNTNTNTSSSSYSGFSPHRDRQPLQDDVPSSFHNREGDAKFVTLWMALTDATPENSCLYMIPKWIDPGYYHGDTENDDDCEGSSSPLHRALANKEAFQHIRAMPRRAGQAVLFTHRTIHWGSSSSSSASSNIRSMHSFMQQQQQPQQQQLPRISLSFVCCDPDFEAPYLQKCIHNNINHYHKSSRCSPPHKEEAFVGVLGFEDRLLLVCAQVLLYQERFPPLSRTVRAFCYHYVKAHEECLEPQYRHRVLQAFVEAAATAAATATAGPNPNRYAHDHDNDDDDNDSHDDEEEEEALMEEMLNAEVNGYGGEFADDFDELVQQENEQQEEKERKNKKWKKWQ